MRVLKALGCVLGLHTTHIPVGSNRSIVFRSLTKDISEIQNMSMERNTMNIQEKDARQIFLAGVRSVIPNEFISSKIRRRGDNVTVNDTENIRLDQYDTVNVVGFGKAVLPMAEEMVKILRERLNRCVVSVPEGTRDSDLSVIEINRGAKNNIPDENSASAAQKIVQLVRSCTESDLLLVLISGGGSALLPAPKSPITLSEKGDLIKTLSRAGATINELNAVRRKISLVKGGGLVHICKAKKIVSLILSDVLGDPLTDIASGPTARNVGTAEDAISVVKKYIGDLRNLPESIQKVLLEPDRLQRDFTGVSNFIVGNNKIALQQSSVAAATLGYHPMVITSKLEGEARVVGEKLARLACLVAEETIRLEKLAVLIKELHLEEFEESTSENKSIHEFLESVLTARRLNRDLCLLLGGETTVRVVGNGVGGRNQELALSCACQLNELQPNAAITMLSGGTDGIDGPCEMAGAVVNSLVVERAQAQNIQPMEFLRNNDSHRFFKQVASGRHHLHTGHTGTNVCDIVVILISSKSAHRAKSRF